MHRRPPADHLAPQRGRRARRPRAQRPGQPVGWAVPLAVSSARPERLRPARTPPVGRVDGTAHRHGFLRRGLAAARALPPAVPRRRCGRRLPRRHPAPRASVPFAGATLGALTAFLTVRLALGAEHGTASEPYVAVAVAVAWLIGYSVHQSRSYDEQLRAQLAVQIAARAVAAERLSIARELHDMVAHTIGIIALQAGAAARVVGTQPESARQAMLAVESASRETLAGLRRMLVALRESGDEQEQNGQGALGAPLAPAVGVADVERLAAETTAAGVKVEVRWEGERRPLPPEIDLSAFRIIQESVTNVVRHAGTDTCEVTVAYLAQSLAISVTDRGPGAGSTASTGFGLTGMRERVALLHGEFSAVPRPEGGFRVAARLPIPPVPAPSGAQPDPTGAR
ncbi:signal transduction histidine kinase [Streptomyces sp. SPB074]|nr:signal transduction histidine kinase [Streptomyces sp. SPB074]